MKDLYREETNHDVYADYCCEKPAGNYADEYVRWLEEKLSKLSQHDVIMALPSAREVRINAEEMDSSDFDKWYKERTRQ